ncbi:Tn3 family transposase, partial [Serratia nevei]|uniref:Tn3 family transposase n=1 Tax=Serratia nevei TaxID=2703794 RepID=UPI00254E1392
PKTSIIRTPTTSLKTSIKTITNLSDTNCLEIQGASLVYLERAAHALRGNGHAVDDSLLQYLSPLGWEHINLTGDYLWRSSAKIGAGKFRPLRPLQPA